jgi:hypothetical protein
VNGVEQERLKQALDRLIEAQREALNVILEEVAATLEGAQEDVRGILGGEGVTS